MLEKACRTCGCPLFEVKGKTLCVVCAEKKGETGSEKAGSSGRGEAPPTPQESHSASPTSSPLEKTLEETLVELCARIREEKDPRCVAALMEAISLGIDGLKALRSR